ncbi:hypothetical protein K461DRAFT_317653 [Myriangium duriaei CBS 260.36]|uniref:Uncharacterized protein n=1 Tax=Myriangium duriaei CBS 260.36 TaxID=1168546 RepID=A0A9P4J9K5_9PEZI|nr:hypothetical protein K461DRAFT_317653 [Myriangium duriaei CBS 260.36]
MAHRTAHSVLHHAHFHQHAHQRRAPDFFGTSTSNDPPSLIRRAEHTCGADGKSSCDTPAATQAQGNLVIALAAAIPATVALIAIFFLHRRIKRKLRHEDANDKHKSLDFGLDEVPSGPRRKGKNGPEMAMNMGPHTGRRDRQLSMDMDLAGPYLLPAAVHGSKDSFHSLSRTHSDPNDPYRPSTWVGERDRSPSRLRNDNRNDHYEHDEKFNDPHSAGLLQNAANMPQNDTPNMNQKPYGFDEKSRQLPDIPPPRQASLPKPTQKQDRWYPADDPRYGSESPPDISGMAPQTPQDMLSNKQSIPAFPQPARIPLPPTPAYEEDKSFHSALSSPMYPDGDALRINVPSPTHDRHSLPKPPAPLPSPPKDAESQPEFQFELDPPPVPAHESDAQDTHLPHPNNDMRRVSVMGMRPLPLEDPSDNPEQRANRIRSFYREYFDDSKPNPPDHYPLPDQYAHEDSQDYYGDVLDDGMVYDPNSGAFYYAQPQKPFAEPVGRRAMTPPPRAPGQMRGGHRSVMSTQSTGRPVQPPKKRMPPPKPLASLPTPHLLRDDSSLTDFAPRTTFRDRQLGRAPDSPLGTMRPFSPAFRPNTPLVGSFDDLAVMPSPHALRKSGTFTALDFAPPPKFRDRADTMSDSGSIRSNRSGMSALQREAIRAGAYRVSRLPTDQVGTYQDFNESLKPRMDISR